MNKDTQEKIREELEKLVYDNCCKTINKDKFQPYEKYIAQALSAITKIIEEEKEKEMKIEIDEDKMWEIIAQKLTGKTNEIQLAQFIVSSLATQISQWAKIKGEGRWAK